MEVTFATGSDARLFWNVCALSESFAQQNPGYQVQVADFGLTQAQSQFLHHSGVLHPAPSHLCPLPHPWICKTALPAFVPHKTGALAWIDADMLAVGPCVEDAAVVAEALAQHGGSAAVCRDDSGLSVGAFVAAYREAGMPVEPFDALLLEKGIDRSSAYLNTGFFIVTDPDFWTAWHQLTKHIDRHVAFDQSTFNALVHSDTFHHLELDAASWNIHNTLLAEDGFSNSDSVEPARFLHPTSQASEHHRWETLTLYVEGVANSLEFKTFRRDDLRNLHLAALQSFISRNLEGLRAAGLISSG